MNLPANKMLFDLGSQYIYSGNLIVIEMTFWEFSNIRASSWGNFWKRKY